MKERNYAFDFIRVISMLLVIVIHLSNYYCRGFSNLSNISYLGAVIWNALARVAVPLFFMLSGVLLLNKEHNKDKYKERIIKYTLILIIWSVIYYVWHYLFHNIKFNLPKDIFIHLFQPVSRHLWFMYPLIGIYIILPFIQSMFKNITKQLENLFLYLWIISSGGVYILRLILSMFKYKVDIIYPIPIVQATYYLGYFIAGYIIYNRIKDLKDTKKVSQYSLITLILTSLITIILTYIISVINGGYYTSLFAYRSPLMMLSSMAVFILSVIHKDTLLKGKAVTILKKIVPYSFGIYLIHIIFFNLLTNNIKVLNVISFIGIPIFSLLIFIISYIACVIIKKIPILKRII